jgi:tyrosinase
MRDSFHYQTASNTAITRFKSEKSGVRSTVLDQHAKAEVRLHRVQVSNLPSAIIRVYLNEPDACNHTSIINNDHYVGQITTFHGSCYGGPGHCNLPLEKSRRSDQRQLHHHEPRNYRLDASDTVKRLLAKGEDDLSVHLVVVGIDGQPIDNALFLDGVSLNFFD